MTKQELNERYPLMYQPLVAEEIETEETRRFYALRNKWLGGFIAGLLIGALIGAAMLAAYVGHFIN